MKHPITVIFGLLFVVVAGLWAAANGEASWAQQSAKNLAPRSKDNDK